MNYFHSGIISQILLIGFISLTTLGVIKTAVEGVLLGKSNISSVPNIEIAYSKGMTEWFSIGIIGAYQGLSISEDYLGY